MVLLDSLFPLPELPTLPVCSRLLFELPDFPPPDFLIALCCVLNCLISLRRISLLPYVVF